MNKNRRESAYQTRLTAAYVAKLREHPSHKDNGDEYKYAGTNYAMSFTKGLEHSDEHGLVKKKEDFEAFRKAIDDGFIDAFTTDVKPGPVDPKNGRRDWEAPTAGFVYDLEGPDAQAVTMLPAPALGSEELAYEMAEVYELALLRDVPLTEFAGETTNNPLIKDSLDRLNALPYDIKEDSNRIRVKDPRRPRTTTNNNGKLDPQTLFRGSSPGVEAGPYLSQFMLIGNEQPGYDSVACGFVQYGAITIDQRVLIAKPEDYLTEKCEWLKAQNGEDLRNNKELFSSIEKDPKEDDPKKSTVPRRFITFPRDLATYVHDDALYEAYLNACLILLSMKAPLDPAFGNLSGEVPLMQEGQCPVLRTTVGFALYGGPHILTLVTEVATRALKAVRYQKFNNHIRLRPEALAARVEYAGCIENAFPSVGKPFTKLAEDISATVAAICDKNESNTALLPMAFQEGSPMHPAYGAGHATVAGACVTILKAFFDTNAVFVRRDGHDIFASEQEGDCPVQYVPDENGEKLTPSHKCDLLTLEGELNKLAANISIGRNMAGVHYYSDYYDSLRMGEEIAIGMLEEQSLCYPKDAFKLTLRTFDGACVSIFDGKRVPIDCD
ncbi:MAG: vanadium-dependent haloperoxidase [Cyanobacteria bacterium P01_D01_bin.105]